MGSISNYELTELFTQAIDADLKLAREDNIELLRVLSRLAIAPLQSFLSHIGRI